MPFTDAAIYYRTVASTAVITPDPSDLPAAQFIAFNDLGRVLVSIQDAEQPNVSDDPAYDASGPLVIEKQFNGTFGESITLVIKSDKGETAFRTAIRGFYRRIHIEPAYHEFGIFGFFHPVLTDFNIDPTNRFGYTMDAPIHTHVHGAETVETRLTFRIGGFIDEI